MVVPCRLRVGEGYAERRCNHETHECALDERSAHYRNLMPAETVRKGFRQRLHAFGV